MRPWPILLALILSLPAGVPAWAAPESPRNANYAIDARLDPATRTITGHELITWRNITGKATSELRFHLYYNAWKNSRSTWLREQAAASGRAPSVRQGEWGWTEVNRIQLVEGGAPSVDLTGTRRFEAPDDGNRDDETVMVVPLPQPVRPGETVNVVVDWTAHVPRTFSRTGVVGRFYFLAQWFPKLGVLEDTGWNCHQFHAETEFFSDYGVYDARLTVPAGWVVGATGTERDHHDNADGTTTHHFYQADVHDFAWTTSPDYIEHHATFQHPGLPPVRMRLLLQPEHESQMQRHFAATAAALRYYGTWYGPYPYDHITIIDPAWQSGAGGMEYPTLFTGGSRWLAPRDVTSPEGVVVHECGHQFWYALVGNNEFEDAWMDEGLNTYSTARAEAAAFTPHYLSTRFLGGFVPYVFHDIALERETDGNGLANYRAAPKLDAEATPTWQYSPASAGSLSYSKTALWLNTLERYLGWGTMQKIMATYFQRWEFHHPKPQDFFAVVNEVSGRDMTWFFDQVYRGSNVFDYALDTLSTEPVGDSGFFTVGGRTAFKDRAMAPGRYRTRVVARRVGEAIFPVDVLVRFANGETVREHWSGQERWHEWTYEKGAAAVSAEVDPDHVLLLDLDMTNNSRTLAPRAKEAATKWTLRWLGWLQDQLLSYAYFV